MKNNRFSMIFLILLVSQVLFVSIALLPTPQANDNNTLSLAEPKEYDVSETDLNRVDTTINMFSNGGFEEWLVPHEPEELTIVRSQMIDMDLEYTIVSEGDRSAQLMAKGIDYYHPAYAYLFLQSWSALTNPANLTVSFDYYIDALANPDLGDCLELYLPFQSSNRNIYYRIGSSTSPANTSNTVYYLLETGPIQQWNTFSRNVTQDYIDAFGTNLYYLSRFQFHVISYEYEWTRAYIDNVYFVNGTDITVGGSVNAGNFETGFTGSWWWGFDYDAGSGDISQSTTRVEGDWSLNMTINTRGDPGFARFSTYIGKMPTTLNKDNFKFYWNIADWQVSTYNSRAYMWVEYSNSTHDGLYIFYSFGYGGGPQTFGGSDDIEFMVDGFNTTGVWNLFNRSIVDDVHSRYPNADVVINQIYFYASAEDAGSRVSILFDDASLTTSILHDGGYEDQGNIGDPIYGWNDDFSTEQSHTVTDFSCNGEKAANITLENDNQLSRYQYFGDIPISDSNEFILDLNWYIESFNQSSNDYLAIILYFDDNTLVFSIANASSLESDLYFGEEDVFIPQPETNTVGAWVNWQVDIAHTFETAFGGPLDTSFYDIELWGSADAGSKLTVLMDDFYIYEDPAPEVTDVEHTPLSPEAGGSVLITASALDATLSSVTVNYRVNDSSWLHTEMSYVSGTMYELNITGLLGDTVVDYSITAVDAFGKTTVAMNDTEYFSFIVGSSTTTIPENAFLLIPIVIAVILIAVGVTLILYLFIYKKR